MPAAGLGDLRAAVKPVQESWAISAEPKVIVQPGSACGDSASSTALRAASNHEVLLVVWSVGDLDTGLRIALGVCRLANQDR